MTRVRLVLYVRARDSHSPPPQRRAAPRARCERDGGKKNENIGRVYRGYQCPSRKRRGSSTCSNTLTVSQKKIETAVVEELKKKLFTPENLAFYETRFRQAFADARKDQGLDAHAKDVERQLGEAKKAVENLVGYLKARATPRPSPAS
jgi:hypothetical protein